MLLQAVSANATRPQLEMTVKLLHHCQIGAIA
jgi:hypothetical protein